MKKLFLSSTLVTAALAGVLLFVPSQASANDAREKYASLRATLAKSFHDGELSITGTLKDKHTATFSALLNGQPLPPDIPIHVTCQNEGNYLDSTVIIDFSDANFLSIRFGEDRNTLLMTPKASPKTLDVVLLDPKTGKLRCWSVFKNGVRETVNTYSQSDPGYIYKPNKDEPSSYPDQITAHIRFLIK